MSAGSFDTRRSMIPARAAKTGNITFMLAAMTAMLPNWLRFTELPFGKKPTPTQHGHNCDPRLGTAHHRCTPPERLRIYAFYENKRAVRRNRHKDNAMCPF